MTKSLDIIENALLALRKGKPVILVDDEFEKGELVLAAEKAGAESLNLITTYGRGLICLAMEPSRFEALGLPLMTNTNKPRFGRAYTLSIDAREGMSTGSSVQDRARTIQTAIDPAKKGHDLITPGHVFLLKSRWGGVLERPGHTEGAVDLARLSGSNPSAVVTEILKEDGSLAKREDLEKLKTKLNIPLVSIKDLIHYRLYYEKTVQNISKSTFISQHGSFMMHTFENAITKKKHTALIKGKPKNECLVRIHEGCQASESFAFMGCACTSKLSYSLLSMEECGSGILMYFKDEKMDLRHCERKRDLLQNHLGPDYHIADAAQILKSLDIMAVRLMTNDLKKVEELMNYGIQVVEMVPIPLSLSSNSRPIGSMKSSMEVYS